MDTELKAILNTIEGTNFSNVQSIDLLMEHGFKLQQWMAYSGEQMAVAKENLHKARRQAMVNLLGSMGANQKQLSPSLQKDYVNDLCASENATYELASRTNSACIHSMDFIRTCISALKTERQTNHY